MPQKSKAVHHQKTTDHYTIITYIVPEVSQLNKGWRVNSSKSFALCSSYNSYSEKLGEKSERKLDVFGPFLKVAILIVVIKI